MNKRDFLVAGALGTALPLPSGAAQPGARTGPGLLTVSGAIGRSNRGPLDCQPKVEMSPFVQD